jgi:hypothetical protein
MRSHAHMAYTGRGALGLEAPWGLIMATMDGLIRAPILEACIREVFIREALISGETAIGT